MSEIKNINTLASDVDSDFRDLVAIQIKLECGSSLDYRQGFEAGVKALQMRFIRAMERNELHYAKTYPVPTTEKR